MHLEWRDTPGGEYAQGVAREFLIMRVSHVWGHPDEPQQIPQGMPTVYLYWRRPDEIWTFYAEHYAMTTSDGSPSCKELANGLNFADTLGVCLI